MVWISSAIPDFVARTFALWALLLAIAAGSSVRSTWPHATHGLTLRSGYRLRARLAGSLPHLRSRLLELCAPPQGESDKPLAQLAAHFQRAFPHDPDPLLAFQRDVGASIFER